MGAWTLWGVGLLVALVPASSKKKAKKTYEKIDQDDDLVCGMLIDAGSQGSRLHMYQWRQRKPDLTVPLTSEKWTEKIKPGIAMFHDLGAAADSILPLIEAAKKELALYEKRWHRFPIYVKATAGLRALPFEPRLLVMENIRKVMRKESPFAFFADENVRVISGEEEAAYAWVGVNYVNGALEDALNQGVKFGTAEPRRARGTLEMGGSSSQIAFYRPQHDVLANLFKLQLGTTAHLNLYAHSFLHYGHASARMNMWQHLARTAGCFDDGDSMAPRPCTIVDECLPLDATILPKDQVSVIGAIGLSPPYTYEPLNGNVTIIGGFNATDERDKADHFAKCLAQTEVLFDHQYSRICDWSHRGQCSFNGVYQPDIPDVSDPNFGEFVLLGGYTKVYNELGLRMASMDAMRTLATEYCATKTDLSFVSHDEFCFMAAFAYSMVTTGHHFESTRPFTAIGEERYRDTVQLVKLGWPLGAMLYEINALPWTYVEGNDDDDDDDRGVMSLNRTNPWLDGRNRPTTVPPPPEDSSNIFVVSSPVSRFAEVAAIAAAAVISISALLVAFFRHPHATTVTLKHPDTPPLRVEDYGSGEENGPVIA